MSLNQLQLLEELVRQLYESVGAHELPFHGWPHICFVRRKAVEFAKRSGADSEVVAAAALVHDLNYIAKRNSEPIEGRDLRRQILAKAGLTEAIIEQIELLIDAAHIGNRGSSLSPEAAALSDADTLFKALPITPVVLSHLFLRETGLPLAALAHKIVGEQRPLLAEGIYFYSAEAEHEYGDWARTNVSLWSYMADCLRDTDVKELLGRLGVE